ncbi:MAG: hypothetical protein ACREDK_01665 [Thermoplasmata archaeon]
MEYVILRAAHPTWLTLQLPNEVAQLIQYDPDEVRDLRSPGRGIAFLARGPGIVRVVASFRAPEILAIETVRNRFIAPARLTDKLVFNLPAPVVRHLGLQTSPRGPNDVRATDDSILWFLPAPEYYEFRARERSGKGWTGPSPGGFAHVYLTRSLLPFAPELSDLEARIEAEEWRPRVEALQRVRPRR